MAAKTRKNLKGYPKSKKKKDGVGVRGFFRLNIEDETGKIVGDSGWVENNVTIPGLYHFVVRAMGASTGSSVIGFAGLGNLASNPVYSDGTNLPGETYAQKRASVSFTTTASNTVRYLGTFDSANAWLTTTASSVMTVNNIGLFASSVTGAGTIFAGKSFASSVVYSNNNVNFTYDLVFSSTT